MRRRTWVGALLATALCPAAAEGATYCVAPTGCTHTTLAAAVATANGTAGVADRIEVRAGTHEISTAITHTSAGGALEIVGAGKGATVMRATPSIGASYALTMGIGGSITDLTLELPAGNDRLGLRLTHGWARRVDVLGPTATAGSSAVTLSSGADAEDVRAEVARDSGTPTYGVQVDDDDDTRLVRVTAAADYPLTISGVGGGATTVLHGVRVTGKYAGVRVRNGASVVADGLLADIVDYAGEAVVLSGTVDGRITQVTLRHATLRGPASSIGILLAPDMSLGSAAWLTAREVAVIGPEKHVERWANTPASTRMDVAWSSIDPARTVPVLGSGTHETTFGPGMVTSSELGIAATGDATPAAGSPLIDAGQPGEAVFSANVFDVLGAPRVQDGNGDGTARRDIGAVEVAAPVLPPPPPAPPAGGSGAGGGPGITPPPPTLVQLPTLTIPKRGLRLDARRRVALALTCPAGGPVCAGIVTLKSAKAIAAMQRVRKRVVTLGAIDYTIPAGTKKTVRVRVSRKMGAYLRRKGKLAVAAHLVASRTTKRVVPFTLR